MRLRRFAAAVVGSALLLPLSPAADASPGVASLAVPVGNGDLRGVSCPAADDCWAVGTGPSPQTEPPGLDAAALWHGNGKRWTSLQVDLPAELQAQIAIDGQGRSGDGLSDVTCLTRTNCWAVGYYSVPLTGENFFRNFILHWDGHGWAETAAPSPPDFGGGGLLEVACASASDCWTVGGSGNLEVGLRTQALHWNGHAWSLAVLPINKGSLNGVGCAAGVCWAVGSLGNRNVGPGVSSGTGALVLRLFHGRASKSSVPATVARELNSVWCTSASQCLAVGTTKAGANVAVRWSSAGLVRTALPGITNPEAVTCTTVANCWVVGTDGVLHGNGRGWTPVHFPKPAHATNYRLEGLKCRSASSCWVTGFWYGERMTALGNVNGSVTAYWDGASWKLH